MNSSGRNIRIVAGIAILCRFLLAGNVEAYYPPPILLKIDGNEQTGGFIASCWNSICADTFSINTPAEPLLTRSPFTAHLRLPLQEPPEKLGFIAAQVTDINELDQGERATYGGRAWNIEWNEWRSYNVSLERESDINLSLEPGLYVLTVDAHWKKGSAAYGFLVQVYEPESDNADESPLPALLKINGNEQTSGIGSYCWNVENETTKICTDANGIITPREPLLTISPFTAHLHMPLEEPPQELGFSTAQVRDKNESYETRNDFFRTWSFDSNEWYWHNLPSGNESDIDLSFEPGLYVLDVDAKWKDKGSVSYGFLVQVYDPAAEVTTQATEKASGFQFALAITIFLAVYASGQKRTRTKTQSHKIGK
jgi:hypothetical protein